VNNPALPFEIPLPLQLMEGKTDSEQARISIFDKHPRTPQMKLYPPKRGCHQRQQGTSRLQDRSTSSALWTESESTPRKITEPAELAIKVPVSATRQPYIASALGVSHSPTAQTTTAHDSTNSPVATTANPTRLPAAAPAVTAQPTTAPVVPQHLSQRKPLCLLRWRIQQDFPSLPLCWFQPPPRQ
jgi:hypothetical protein